MKLYLYVDEDEEYKAVATELEIIKKANIFIKAYNKNGEFGEYFIGSDVDGIDRVQSFSCAIKVLDCMGIYIKKLTIFYDDATIENLEKYGWMEV